MEFRMFDSDKANKLFMASGIVWCGVLIHSSYRYYMKDDYQNATFGVAMGVAIIWIYFLNYRFIYNMTEVRYEILKSMYKHKVSKMEVEITMRRAGVDVPKEFEADIPTWDELDPRSLLVRCDNKGCEDKNSLRKIREQK